MDEYGPVVDAYPSWHPLVTNIQNACYPQTIPNKECGYEGLDHTIYFANAFITCPYGNGKEVLNSVGSLQYNPAAKIYAERLNVQLYDPKANPIIVWCEWSHSIGKYKMIPTSVALPLMLQKEIPCWEWSERGETWETMRPYFLGSPHGSRSSLFVNQETGLAMKKVWDILLKAEVFGPIKN